jgi:hypothetical protein
MSGGGAFNSSNRSGFFHRFRRSSIVFADFIGDADFPAGVKDA